MKLPDFEQTFEVQTNALNFSIGRVLMQDIHLVDFKSRKLQDRERRYLVHEKKMTIVVHCLQLWRHYLLRKPFVIKTDNVAMSYSITQPKFSSKKARW